MTTHPFVRYGEAVVRHKTAIQLGNNITNEIIAQQLEEELNSFRVQPVRGNILGSNAVHYHFVAIEKGKPDAGVFLSPNVLASDKAAGNVWATTKELLGKLRMTAHNPAEDARMSYMPISGEFLSFGSSGSIGRGKSRMNLQDAGFAAIATLTRSKPSLQYREINQSPVNMALLPDLELPLLLEFVRLFEQLRATVIERNLQGKRFEETKAGKITVKLNRPNVYRGNFPEAPQSSVMCALGLLAGMGEFIRRMDEDQRERYLPLIEALKSAPIYMIQYGSAKVTRFNHYIVEMAKHGQLRSVIDCVYHSRLFKEGARTHGSFDYQKFDFFYSRFLQLFTPPAFQDFMAFRAEYPTQITSLFYTYFTLNKKSMITTEIVKSAIAVGRHINRMAGFRAAEDLKKGNSNLKYWELKSRYLVGIESMVFAGKEGHNIIGTLATTIGRASKNDFPSEAEVLFQAIATNDITPEQAKNLLMAFSRIAADKGEEGNDTSSTDEEDAVAQEE